LVTAPGLLERTSFSRLAHCKVPLACPKMPMYLMWHVRYQQDNAHRWLRALLEAIPVPSPA